MPGCHGVLFLPYITGERFPVIDPDIRGAYYGITPDTSAEDLTRACLEGVAFSVRQGLELIDCEVKSVSLIGGGCKSRCLVSDSCRCTWKRCESIQKC